MKLEHRLLTVFLASGLLAMACASGTTVSGGSGTGGDQTAGTGGIPGTGTGGRTGTGGIVGTGTGGKTGTGGVAGTGTGGRTGTGGVVTTGTGGTVTAGGTGGGTASGSTDCFETTTYAALCTPTCPNISDLEMGFYYFGNGCPKGAWTLSTGGGGTTTPPVGSVTPVAVTDLAGSTKAIHVSGSGQANTAGMYDAYVSLSASLNSPSSTMTGAVNASTYTGVKFMGKISGSVELHVPNVNTNSAGGKCTAAGTTQCSDDGKVALTPSTTWTQYMIPFASLMSSVPPFGNPAGTPFPAGQIYSIEWHVPIPATGPTAAWDIWVDNLAFY
jgi:hypothetical protein